MIIHEYHNPTPEELQVREFLEKPLRPSERKNAERSYGVKIVAGVSRYEALRSCLLQLADAGNGEAADIVRDFGLKGHD